MKSDLFSSRAAKRNFVGIASNTIGILFSGLVACVSGIQIQSSMMREIKTHEKMYWPISNVYTAECCSSDSKCFCRPES